MLERIKMLTDDERAELEISERELYEIYDESLDDAFGNVAVAGFEFSTSDALKRLDPVAYQTGFNDWIDGEFVEFGDVYIRISGL